MFGTSGKMSAEVAGLQSEVAELRKAVQTLRQHVAGLSNGVPIPVDAILQGLGYGEVSAQEFARFIERTEGVIVLDVRDDAAWDAGHIPIAKHIPATQVATRLHEMQHMERPVIIMGTDGGAAERGICDLMVQAGYQYVFLAVGGMAAYQGPTVESKVEQVDVDAVRGEDRETIAQIAKLIDSDVRPSLVRDGGDLQFVAFEDGVVKIKMTGACQGCGAQSATVQGGIKTYLMHMVPAVKDIEDLTGAA